MIFKLLKTHDVVYPLMRDPQRNSRCYEMTEQERIEAVQRVEQILKDRELDHSQGYYGA